MHTNESKNKKKGYAYYWANLLTTCKCFLNLMVVFVNTKRGQKIQLSAQVLKQLRVCEHYKKNERNFVYLSKHRVMHSCISFL
jgi:hypothetical protein